jgi:hypothetical protein
MKAICSNNFFVVSRQKACIKNITEPDLPENKLSGKNSATIISCNPGSLPKPENLFSLSLHQIKILASSFSRLVYPPQAAPYFNRFTPAPSGWGFTNNEINQ